MKTLISCAYNMDNCCVELKFNDGSMIAIDTIAVENEVARNMYERSELDYLIFNAPLEYADLIVKAKLFCPEIAGLFCRIAGLFCHDSRANLSLKPVCFGIAIS